MKTLALALLSALALALVASAPAAGGTNLERDGAGAGERVAVLTATPSSRSEQYRHHSAREWAIRALNAEKREHLRILQVRRQRRSLARHWAPTVARAIAVASVVYRVPHSLLYRRIGCETGWSFDPGSFNPASSASGAMQFLPSTWSQSRNPFHSFSIFDPMASVLAGAYFERQGWGNEWQCQ